MVLRVVKHMFKQFGAVYLILGTCVAAGMLGLPVVSASSHFQLTCIMLLVAWILMTAGAWALLKVNLALPEGNNMITMSEATLGPIFKYITWVVYLMLLYTLICAYLAASGDLLHTLLHTIHLPVDRTISTVLVTIILGSIVYAGIGSVDGVNRLLMTAKIVICLVVIATSVPSIKPHYLSAGNYAWHGSTFLVMICSFGYAIILPSIRVYLKSDGKALYRVLLIGSVLPVILYVFWIAAVQGAVPRTGVHGLLAMNGVADTTSRLMLEISHITHKAMLHSLSIIFVSICSITGFLGVSLALMDFLADGFKQPKQGLSHFILAVVTYLPPMLIVIFAPSLFIHALAYAGMCCIYILIALPILMWLVMQFRRN